MGDPAMGRDDTFPLSEERSRSCFQRLTTKEAGNHAEIIWPFLDVKVEEMLDEKVKHVTAEAARDALFQVISDLMELDSKSADDRNKIKRLFRLLCGIMAAQSVVARICFRCILPWTVAALIGALSIALKDYVPSVAAQLQKLGLPNGP
jgi:hypothetical protein